MLKRKITKQMEAWKNEPHKPCLLVRGARQVGKTFTIEQFARANYKNYIYINFELMPEQKKIFDGNLDFKTLKMQLEAFFPGIKIEKGQTLLFLDEIEACPNARVALKSFALDGTLDVVASGSLLGLYYKEISSYPVGYERSLEMYPLDFEEFLWAIGLSEDVILETKRSFETKTEMLPNLEKRLDELFRIFMLVGGMPAVVNTYLETESLTQVREIQRSLIENYKNDVIKYASTSEKPKILKTFESIPVQLAKKNKKFMWSDIDMSDVAASERKYGSALNWLKDAGIVNFCHNLLEPTAPLATNVKIDSYKVYMRDTGLLMAMLDSGLIKNVLNGDEAVNEGGITENVVAAELASRRHSLAYFEKRGELEVDFVLNLDGEITAVEVKSGKHTGAKSLNLVMKNYQGVKRYIKFERETVPFRDADGVEHYPLFMAMWI